LSQEKIKEHRKLSLIFTLDPGEIKVWDRSPVRILNTIFIYLFFLKGTESTGGSTVDILTQQYPQRGALRKQTSLDQQSQVRNY